MGTLTDTPRLLEGGLAIDDRGQLAFVRSFDFKGIKRFYIVENFSTQIIRAWHGHIKEAKYVLVVRGSAIVAAVEMNDTERPNRSNPVHRFVLSARKPGVLFIPAGYANGFRSLEEGTKIVYFSTCSLEESKNDDYRFPFDYWGKEVWQIENR
jgi:dTDP-4-dehydrorhamnose 3,5-epimerase